MFSSVATFSGMIFTYPAYKAKECSLVFSSWLLELIMEAAVGVLWIALLSCITSEMAMPAILTICGNFSLIAM